ncbi:LolA family protein [Pseudarthrobacter sp. P1]|uniref:LolA family protein n=1 Tax=Pseudarthrobacter sp. P1 TaxID=3418418 RepID=UPI003CF370D8
MNSLWRRWAPAAVVPMVIAAGVLAAPFQANAEASLPAKTAEQVLALVANAPGVALSGTVEQTSDLGLPQLPQYPGKGAASDPAGTALLDLLTAPHTARVYLDGASGKRVQVMDRLAERDLVRNGTDLWLYDSRSNAATHLTLPSGHEGRKAAGAEMMLPAPDAIAHAVLSALDPSTDVALGAKVRVAGRAAYELVLTPRSTQTLVASVSLAVDGATGLPLDVTVRARGQEQPAFRIAFTSLTLGAPDPALFTFTPPAGATVHQIDTSRHQGGPGRHGPGSSDTHAKAVAGHPTVTGSGWDAVVELPGTGMAQMLAAVPLLAQAAQAVPGGRLLSTSLVNAYLADDGRVFIGSVPLALLQAAAAAG